MRRWTLTFSFWNSWTKPRVERPADGSVSVYYGVGRWSWKIAQKPLVSKEIQRDDH